MSRPSHLNQHLVCDLTRVDRFLSSDSYRLEDEALASHLDSCATCRGYLEEQAGPASVWTDLRTLLQPGEFDEAGAAAFSAATLAGGGAKPVAAQDVLDSLAPTDDPHRLGRVGNYEVTGVVGVGGMGVVLKAIDPSLDRVVAVKVMAPQLANNEQARQRFAREAKAAAAVLHPNVIPIHSVSSSDSLPYLVMAYVRGGSLQKRLDQEGPLPLVEVLRIGSQIAAGLAAAHEQGLIHRDIKPENVLLEEGVERVTITDFGLARAVDDNSVTQAGAIAGTPMYMSPEQARGEKLDQQSDLFSLGSVLYALCVGKPPYTGDSSFGVMRKIVDDSPVPLREANPEVPDWLAGIVERLMAKDKADRFTSAAEVHALLDACISHVQQPESIRLPEKARRLTVQPPFRRRSRRVPGRPLTLVVILCALAAFAGLMLQQNQERQRRQKKMRRAYSELRSYFRTGDPKWMKIQSLDLLLSHPDGYPLLSQLDDQFDRFVFTDSGLPHNLKAAALLLHVDAAVNKPKLTLRAARKEFADGPSIGLPQQLRVDALTLEPGSVYEQKVVIRYSASTEPQHRETLSEMLKLKPGSEYTIPVAVADMIQDRVDWNYLWKDGQPTGVIARSVKTGRGLLKPDTGTAVAAVKAIVAGLNIHKARHGRYPTMEEGLRVLTLGDDGAPVLQPSVEPGSEFLAADPWGRPYGYQNPGRHGASPDVWSVGPDGKTNTGDDICSWKLPMPDDLEGHADQDAIQGTWRVVFVEDSGRTGSPESLHGSRFVITRSRLTMQIGGRETVSTYTLDPTTSPKSIDLTENGRTKPGIYDLQGSTLRICVCESSDDRPTAFDSQPNSANDLIFTLKRIVPTRTGKKPPTDPAVTSKSGRGLVNGCEVSGSATRSHAHITIKNPANERQRILFHYQIVYRNSGEPKDAFQFKTGTCDMAVPPDDTKLEVSLAADPNTGMPSDYLKDKLEIRIASTPIRGLAYVPINVAEQIDVSEETLTIAEWPSGVPAREASSPDRLNMPAEITARTSPPTAGPDPSAGLDIYRKSFVVPLQDHERPTQLVVDIPRGRIIVTGQKRDDILVKLSSPDFPAGNTDLGGGVEEVRSRNLDFDITRSENRIKVDSNSRDYVTNLEILVPKDVNLKLDSYQDGVVEVKNVTGEHDIRSHNNDIRLSGMQGAARVWSYNGTITAGFDAAAVDGDLYFESSNGSIEVHLPPSIKANTRVRSGSGKFRTDFEIKTAAPEVERIGEEGQVRFGKFVTGTINGGGIDVHLETEKGDLLLLRKR